jgi:glycosyltransferase involved in cell wall biosynthesis/molybdopterin-guanine dinucleotide biosynthesis protein A
MATFTPLVTVYIPCRDYGHYLAEAIQSVLDQSLEEWELIVIDDGSEDDTQAVIERYKALDPQRISSIRHEMPRGLQVSANEVIREARGRYVMRLDADDYLDESALLVMVNHLERHPDVALVYPNYVYVDESGRVLGVENRRKVVVEAKVLDLPAHGACTMVRKRVLKSVGGYDESFDRQDGHDLWLKVVNRYAVANISTALFYYRQHSASLSRDEGKLLSTRAKIYRAQVDQNSGAVSPRVVAIVGAKNSYAELPNIVLTEVAGKPLIDYTLDVLEAVPRLSIIVVSTDDPAVVEYCDDRSPQVRAHLRPEALSRAGVSEQDVVREAVHGLEAGGVYPDILLFLSVHAPLRRREHVEQAIDSLLLHNVDVVVSAFENLQLHYVHSEHGMEPLNPAMHRQIRVEREAVYTDNGAIRAFWREALDLENYVTQRVGHVIMPVWESYQIKSREDVWLIEQILEHRRCARPLLPSSWDEKEAGWTS